MEGIHVEGHVVKLVPVACDGRIGIAVELGKLLDVVPDLFVAGMEDVGSIAVYLDTLDFLRIDVPCDMGAAVDDEYRPAAFVRFMGEYRAEEAGADD